MTKLLRLSTMSGKFQHKQRLTLDGIPPVADFVHGKNGQGDVSLPLSRNKCDKNAVQFPPEAADVGFISGADITVGINISTQLKLTGVCLHDPLSFVEAVRPDLFKYKKGVF
ncbi:hypothetical protein F2Q70_00028151 [Brassica cretica]|uniref:Uncharacterized protein n=1 Tax=Brassica cretica TaxID=69181 RepID=A0A8S9I6M8_BRACR|nr:hypothetical protein F2Q68_00027723 [Brassica cretica]KAF2602520.1 hypothetical protein F2Q70_00028151 [Brassica cretica]